MRRQTSLVVSGLFVTILMGWFAACGLVESDYQDYSDGQGGTDGATDGTSDDPACKEALLAFETNILSVTDKSCSCHIAGTGTDFLFEKGDAAATRARILEFTGSDYTKLYQKISLQLGTHTGGDLKELLTEDAVNAWASKESECEK